MGANNFVLLK